MLGVIGAMSEEVQLILSEMRDIQQSVHADITVTRGNYKGTEIALAQSGIGKVNATICTQMMIDIYQPEKLVCRKNWCSAAWPAVYYRICRPAISSSPRTWCSTTWI